MLIVVITYLIYDLEGDHIFLFLCLHSDVATLEAMTEISMSRNLISKNIIYFVGYLAKNESHNDINDCLILVYVCCIQSSYFGFNICVCLI